MYNYKELNPEKCEFVVIGSADELEPGERLFVEIDEEPIVIFNIAGQYYAVGDVCSHDDGPVGDGDLEGFEVICPRHGARFDIRTGKVLSLPAIVDIPAYPVRVVDGQLEIGLPVE
ncbi:MAG TPA: non-heme iron oxygenase ferredoxin subunit [Anaerolineales bacterium]|nr:non-heme iron oxygenase ferredoxin subunit [Anaerolineales bacterium]